MSHALPLVMAALDNGFNTETFPLMMIAGAVVVGILALLLLIVMYAYGRLWFQAYMSDARVTIWSLIGMTFRQVDAQLIVRAKVMAMQAGLSREGSNGITTRRLEAHYLAGGDVPR